jgi:hypothetical protein
MSVAYSIHAFESMIRQIANAFTSNIGYYVDSIVVTETFKDPTPSRDVFNAFMKTRQLIVLQVAGVNSQDYLRFVRYTRFINVANLGGGKFQTTITGTKSTKEEAEFVLNFVTDSIIQIENLGSDILNPYDRLN